jgi:hypothetical protein
VPGQYPRTAKPTPKTSVFPGIVPKVKTDISESERALTPEEYRELLYARQKGEIDTYTEAIADYLITIDPAVSNKIKTAVKQVTRSAVDRAIKAMTQGATKTQARSMVAQAVKTSVKSIASTRVRSAVRPYTKAITNSATMVYTQTLAKVQQQVRLFQKTAEALKTAKVPRMAAPRPRIAGAPPLHPMILLPDGTRRPMTPEEMKGAVAWKQGFIYKMVYPPYDNMQNSREPYPGIKVVKGARSAYETIVRLKGRVPAKLAFDMGIMDVFIETPRRGKGKPQLKFKRDVKQETKHTGLVASR